jgi:hypothetical protein
MESELVLAPPALLPITVTRLGLPPNAWMFALILFRINKAS